MEQIYNFATRVHDELGEPHPMWQIKTFRFMFNKSKKQPAPSNSTDAAPVTTTNDCTSRTIEKEKPYFDKKWGIDDDGFATLEYEDDPLVFQTKLQTLIDEVNRGYTEEVYRDKNNHKRSRFHPSHLILGLNILNERFAFGYDEDDDLRKNLNIYRLSGKNYQWADSIDMLDYTRFLGFLPVIDTRCLTFDIWRVLNHEVKTHE